MKFPEKLMARELRKWSDITADPMWYQIVGKERYQFVDPKQIKSILRVVNAGALSVFGAQIDDKHPTKKMPKHTLYLTFEELLANDKVRLGSIDEGCYDWDSERKDLKKIVIHHSRSPKPLRSHYVSAMELLRIYTQTYNLPDQADRNRPGVVGKPIYSGHYDNEEHQGFWIYHWMVRPDGESARYLKDDQIGWQAGNWEINSSSVGICIDDDLSNRSPNEAELESVANVITSSYSHLDITPETLLGHNEVRELSCPGDLFLPYWKGKLLSMISA